MNRRIANGFIIITLLTGGVGFYVQETSAANEVKKEVDELNSAVTNKRKRVKQIDDLIASYRKKIEQQVSKQASLSNEVLLLDNKIKEKELMIVRSQTEAEAIQLEIESLNQVIKRQEIRINKQKGLIAEFIRRLRQSDEVSAVDVMLTRASLSSFFDRLEELKRLERSLGETIVNVKNEKKTLVETKKSRDDRKLALEQEEKAMKEQRGQLEGEKNFKFSLIAQTEQSQEEFERIMYELRQQQQSTTEDISRLERQLKDKLDAVDEALARGDVLLNWPLPPNKGVSATFHDKTYPFRNLFEHPGTDIPTPVGTAVHAAAGGYVAWNKTGRMYGNYTMIVHPGGIATVYAHLSKFIAKPDTYVDRGDVIALSGGRPGDPGAGLSTGPHLHFEVRQGGIPVNAENFLPSLE